MSRELALDQGGNAFEIYLAGESVVDMDRPFSRKCRTPRRRSRMRSRKVRGYCSHSHASCACCPTITDEFS